MRIFPDAEWRAAWGSCWAGGENDGTGMVRPRLAATKALIVEADHHWHGLARFLERSGMDRNDELVGRR
jgi:hypothetical protein